MGEKKEPQGKVLPPQALRGWVHPSEMMPIRNRVPVRRPVDKDKDIRWS